MYKNYPCYPKLTNYMQETFLWNSQYWLCWRVWSQGWVTVCWRNKIWLHYGNLNFFNKLYAQFYVSAVYFDRLSTFEVACFSVQSRVNWKVEAKCSWWIRVIAMHVLLWDFLGKLITLCPYAVHCVRRYASMLNYAAWWIQRSCLCVRGTRQAFNIESILIVELWQYLDIGETHDWNT
jgi:hypothetical protein